MREDGITETGRGVSRLHAAEKSVRTRKPQVKSLGLARRQQRPGARRDKHGRRAREAEARSQKTKR